MAPAQRLPTGAGPAATPLIFTARWARARSGGAALSRRDHPRRRGAARRDAGDEAGAGQPELTRPPTPRTQPVRGGAERETAA